VGLLSVALPAGTHRLVLRHRPPGFAAGLVLTLVGIVLAVAAIRTLTPARLMHWRGALVARLQSPTRSGSRTLL
jgi:hypothetical protein